MTLFDRLCLLHHFCLCRFQPTLVPKPRADPASVMGFSSLDELPRASPGGKWKAMPSTIYVCYQICVYIYIHVYIYMYGYINVDINIYIYIHIYRYPYIYIYSYMYIYIGKAVPSGALDSGALVGTIVAQSSSSGVAMSSGSVPCSYTVVYYNTLYHTIICYIMI